MTKLLPVILVLLAVCFLLPAGWLNIAIVFVNTTLVFVAFYLGYLEHKENKT